MTTAQQMQSFSKAKILSFNEFSPGLSFQFSAIGNSTITQKSIDKLIKLLQLVKEDYPESDSWAVATELKKNTDESTNN